MVYKKIREEVKKERAREGKNQRKRKRKIFRRMKMVFSMIIDWGDIVLLLFDIYDSCPYTMVGEWPTPVRLIGSLREQKTPCYNISTKNKRGMRLYNLFGGVKFEQKMIRTSTRLHEKVITWKKMDPFLLNSLFHHYLFYKLTLVNYMFFMSNVLSWLCLMLYLF